MTKKLTIHPGATVRGIGGLGALGGQGAHGGNGDGGQPNGGKGGNAHAAGEWYDDGPTGYKGPQWALLIVAALAGIARTTTP